MGVLDGVVVPRWLTVSLPSCRASLHGFLGLLQPDLRRRPPVGQDVLVECLARAPPHVKRSGSRLAVVAVAWARMAGWMRVVGQVTPTQTSISSVTCETAPSTLQTNGECPWASIQGW